SWKHWVRNVEPLATRFTVHALDHPSYGDSAPVPRETTGPAYLDLVHALVVEMFPGAAPLRFAGFSFGGAIAANLARRLWPRGTLLGGLARLQCGIRLVWGEGADSAFRPAKLLIGEIREAVGMLDVHRIAKAGHWSAYENAPEVNRLMLEFFST